MEDEFSLVHDTSTVPSSSEDKKNIDLLAKELADSKYEALKSQHRLNELENGRIFRTIRHIKKSLINPAWGLKNIKEIPSLFIKIDVPALIEHPQSSRELLEELGHTTLPAGLHNHPRTLRYPHIKVAILGSPDWFSFVAHTFEINKVEWSQLLKFGIDLFAIKVVDDKEAAIQAIGLMRQYQVPFLWFIDNLEKEFINHNAKDNDLFFSEKIMDFTEGEFIAPSIDITEVNPANWHLYPKYEFASVLGSPSNKERTQRTDVLSVNNNSREFYDKAKQYKYVYCERSNFVSDVDYTKTMLGLYASGVVVISRGSNLIKKIIDTNYHFFSPDQVARDKNIEKLNDQSFRERLSISLRQHVISKHNHINRFEEILDLLGIERHPYPLISIISSTNRSENVIDLINTVGSQSYPNKELVLILHGVDYDIKRLKIAAKNLKLTIKVIKRSKQSLFGENLNLGLDNAAGSFVTKMDDDDYYGKNHLWDLYWSWVYSGAIAVGKWGNFVYLKNRDLMLDFATKREERFGRHLPGATIFMLRNDLEKLRFGRVKRAIDSEMLRRAEMRGGRLYSTHRYNFVRVRHGEHTYKQDDEDFIANSDGKPRKGFNEQDCFI